LRHQEVCRQPEGAAVEQALLDWHANCAGRKRGAVFVLMLTVVGRVAVTL
jgi:hypothetical protein